LNSRLAHHVVSLLFFVSYYFIGKAEIFGKAEIKDSRTRQNIGYSTIYRFRQLKLVHR